MAISKTATARKTATRKPASEANSRKTAAATRVAAAQSADKSAAANTQERELEQELDLMPSDDIEILAAFFKALADPSRLNIVCVLLKYKQLSVGDIALKTNMSLSAVSHQLALLRMRKLVAVKRDGVKNYYALCDNHVSRVIEMAIEHIYE